MDVWVKLEPSSEDLEEELSHSNGQILESRWQSTEAGIVHTKKEALDVLEKAPGANIKTVDIKIEVEIEDVNVDIKQEPLDVQEHVLDFRETTEELREGALMVKQEPSVDQGLYRGCRIKEELVLGPEWAQSPHEMMANEEPSPTLALLVPRNFSITLHHQNDSLHKIKTRFRRSSHVAARKRKQHGKDNPSAADPNTAESYRFICDACGKIYKQKGSLIRHVALHLKYKSKKVHACNVCNKMFPNSSTLRRHEVVHTGIKKYSCESCNKQFSQAGHLKSHKTTHTGERPYACDMCTKRFRRSTHLTIHKRTHSGETPFTCEHCARKFKDSGSLGSHRRIHFEKPHACGTCDKKFIDRRDLIRHERVHTGERPYVCKICNKTYTQIAHLNTHTRTHAG